MSLQWLEILCRLFCQEVCSSPETHMKLEEFCFSPVLTQDKRNQGHEGKDARDSLWSTQTHRNLRGVVKNHKNPISNTSLLLQGKTVCENFPFDFCYSNNSSLDWNSNINLIMTPLRHILWRLISNDFQGFTLPIFCIPFQPGFTRLYHQPSPDQHHHHLGGKDPEEHVLRWLLRAWEYPLI